MITLRRGSAWGLLFVAFGLFMAILPLRAEGKLEVIEKFERGTTELTIAHFTQPDADTSNTKVGLVSIASRARISFAFDQAEWAELIEICDKALAAKSAAWRQVGAMTETSTEDVSHLTVSAGAEVRFVISSPKAGRVSYTFEKADLPRL